MKKIETIWHYLLSQALTQKKYKHTQQSIAQYFNYSLSTVNYSLQIPNANGSVRITSKFFVLEDFKKLLMFFASFRQINKDLFYQTRVEASVKDIEKLVPANSVYAAYSACNYLLAEAPADYDKLFIYLDEKDLELAKSRFPQLKKNSLESNVFVLKKPNKILENSQFTDLILTFVDIWNLKDWYAKDYIKYLEQEIDALLS